MGDAVVGAKPINVGNSQHILVVHVTRNRVIFKNSRHLASRHASYFCLRVIYALPWMIRACPALETGDRKRETGDRKQETRDGRGFSDVISDKFSAFNWAGEFINFWRTLSNNIQDTNSNFIIIVPPPLLILQYVHWMGPGVNRGWALYPAARVRNQSNPCG